MAFRLNRRAQPVRLTKACRVGMSKELAIPLMNAKTKDVPGENYIKKDQS